MARAARSSSTGSVEQSVWRTVVGVVKHVRQRELSEAGGDQLYIRLPQFPQPDGPTRLTKRPLSIDRSNGATARNVPPDVVNAMPT